MSSILAKIKGEVAVNVASCVINNWDKLNTALYILKNDYQVDTPNKNFKPKTNYSNSPHFNVQRNIPKPTNQLHINKLFT